MNIIVHYPKTSERINELQKNVACVHIEAVSSFIKNLSCPKSQKLALIEKLKEIS